MGHVMTLTDATYVADVADKPIAATRERIADLVVELLEKRAVSKTVLADDDLREIGLTSLDMVNLMLAVEAEFDLTIPEPDMTPQNFRSISAIETLVGALRPNA
jgi:acyl carrier protein